VIALLDALKLKKAIIGGHSMGGAIAQTMALNYPDRVQGLILIGTAAKLGVSPAILNGFKSDMRQTVDLLVGLYYGQAGTDTMRRRSTQKLMAFDPQVVSQDYAACNLFDIREQVGRIKQPTLILGGIDDQLTPFKYSEFLHGKIAGSVLVKVEGGGHMMMLEQPEFVGETVRKWLLDQQWAL
jgi:pimeloyl-ACP methyl ester carboxylesterase